MRSRIVFLLLLLLVVIATWSPDAFADGDAEKREDAAVAYDRGAAAYDRGDFVTAARELARADELAQSTVTLELAINAAIRSDDPVLGMTLAERASTRKSTKALDAAAQSARRKFSARVGKLSVMCPVSSGGTRCDVTLDGASFEPNAPRLVAVGSHRVTLTRSSSGSPELFDVVIEPGKTVELIPAVAPPKAQTEPAKSTPAPTPPPREQPSKRKEEGGLSPTWLWIGVGATVVVGGITIASGLDTISKHDAFAADRSNANLANEGSAADQRTTFLLVGTGVLALATAAVGLFVVNWGDGNSNSKSNSNKAELRHGRVVF